MRLFSVFFQNELLQSMFWSNSRGISGTLLEKKINPLRSRLILKICSRTVPELSKCTVLDVLET